MMHRTIYAYLTMGFILMGIASVSCTDDSSCTCPPVYYPPCDTCNNAVPGTSAKLDDVCRMWKGRISPDGRYIAFEAGNIDYAHAERVLPIFGLSVMEISSRSIRHFIPGQFIDWEWSADSRKLYYLYAGRSPINELNLETKSVIEHFSIGSFSSIERSPHGDYLYLHGLYEHDPDQYGIVRLNIANQESEFLGEWSVFSPLFMVINDSTLCSMLTGSNNTKGEAGIYYLNINTGKVDIKHVDMLRNRFDVAATINFSISPDKRTVLFEGIGLPDLDDGYILNGIWTIDLETYEVTKVLDRHAYWVYNDRYPIWSSNSTFTANWYCRRDSTTLLYEYDLNGRPTRQLTYRNTEFWKED